MAADNKPLGENVESTEKYATPHHFREIHVHVPRLTDICKQICANCLIYTRLENSSIVTTPVQDYLTYLLKSEVFSCVSEDILSHLVEFYPDDIDDRCLQVTCPIQLRKITLKGCEKLTLDGVKKALKSLHILQCLDLSKCDQLVNLVSDLDISSKLTSLTLEECDTLTDDMVQNVLRGAPNLKHLNVSCCDNLTDQIFLLNKELQVGRHISGWSKCEDYDCHLTSVDLSCCHGITSSTINDLVTLTGPTLKHVNISSCRKVDCVALLYLCGLDLASVIGLVSLFPNHPDTLRTLHQLNAEILHKQEQNRFRAERDGILSTGCEEKAEWICDECCACDENDDKCSASKESISVPNDENVLVSEIRLQCDDCLSLRDEHIFPLEMKNKQCWERLDNNVGEEIIVEELGEEVIQLDQGLDSTNHKKYLKSKKSEKACLRSECSKFDDDGFNKIINKNSDLHARENNLELKSEAVEISQSASSSAQSFEGIISAQQFSETISNSDNSACNIHSQREENLVLNFCPEVVDGDSERLKTQELSLDFCDDNAHDSNLKKLTDHFGDDNSGLSITNSLKRPDEEEKNSPNIDSSFAAVSCEMDKIQPLKCNRTKLLDSVEASPTSYSTLSNSFDSPSAIFEQNDSDYFQKYISTNHFKGNPFHLNISSQSTLENFPCRQMYSPDLISLDASYISFKETPLEMVRTCLEVLLLCNKNLTKFGFHYRLMTNEILSLIASKAEQLEDVSFVDCDQVTSSGVQSFGEHCKGIKRLDLRGVCFITDSALEPCIMNRKLEHLCLAECGISDLTLKWISEYISETLVSLDLAWCDELTLPGMNAMLSKPFPRLSCLNLRQGPVSNLTLDLLSNHCPALTSLTLSFVSFGVEDDALVNLAKRLPHLTYIDISWNSDLTDRSTEALLRFCPKLKSAIFPGLKRISSDPFLKLIADDGDWLKLQTQLHTAHKDKQLQREATLPLCPEGTELKLPYRSTVFAPNLTFLDLFYCDLVNDLHLANITAVCRGSLKIKDYHGEIMTPSWIPLA